MLHVTAASADLAFQLAEGHWRAGNGEEAEGICRQILEVVGDHLGAMRLVGLRHCMREEWVEGGEVLSKVVACEPRDGAARFNLGRCLYAMGKFHEACGEYERAVKLMPTFSEGWNEWGNALVKIGRADGATEAFERAIALRGGFAEAYNNLGLALRARGQLAEAYEAYERAIGLMPRGEGAARVRNNLGNLQRSMGNYDAALKWYGEAIEMDARYEEAYSNLSVALFEVGRLPEAIAACRKAVDLAKDAATGARMHENILYFLHFLETDPGAILREHVAWNGRWAGSIESGDGALRAVRRERLRIGYVSPDFREHCQEFFLRPLFSNHDRAAVEIFCYSGVAQEDSATRWFRGRADHWREIVGRSDEEVIAMIRGDGIDVLVDLTMHLGSGRELMFARRGAPVQVAWLAYPSTTGLAAMDYRLTDPFLDPAGAERDAFYTEKSVRLESFWCYDALAAGLGVSELPALENGVVTFGCLNNFAKVNGGMLQMWGEVMRRVAGSRLILMAPMGARREEVLAGLGVEEGRVEFVLPVARREYLKRYHRIDLCLDTFPCNGHTTSLDGLWMGVPAVTLCGETAVSRAGLSLLTNLGMPGFVARTREEFVEAAVRWAEDLEGLGRVRAGLRERMEGSVLMDGGRFARGMEEVLRGMWERYQTTTTRRHDGERREGTTDERG